ncbi:MAG TPA: asparagine synthase-related protein [Opitutaceae bacterium]|nr:asparagine synthase-related protein [Opitutaceae bacterium]
MSGIAGIFNFGATVDRDALVRFTDALAHRGPDGRGVMYDGKLGLGHRRLAVFDRTRHGHCPMPYEDSQPVSGKRSLRDRIAAFAGVNSEEAALTPFRYWLTFDGEIYNFPELRRELGAMGYRFRSETDAEVVLAAYAQWGESCLFRFNGSWAFALWDRQERTLFLARDRFGERPLYYTHSPTRLAFASEMKAFLSLDGFRPALKEELVPSLLVNPAAHEGTTDETLLIGLRRLPSGHSARVTGEGALHVRRWWDTREHLPKIGSRYEDHVARCRQLFQESVRLRLRSDVRTGIRQDGSFADSAIAGAAAGLKKTGADLSRVRDKSPQLFVPNPASGFEDGKSPAGTTPQGRVQVITFDPEAVSREVVDAAWSAEVIGPAPATPSWCFYRELRGAGGVISLESHGAEELLGGHPRHLDCFTARINSQLADEFHATRLPALLRERDGCSLAHGVVARSPFLDWELVAFAQTLPASSKFGGGYTQRVLRDAMKDILPEQVLKQRTRARFDSPLAGRFKGRLAPLLRQLVNHPRCLESRHWDGAALRKSVLEKSEAGSWTAQDEAEIAAVWTRLSLVLWQLLFVDGVKPEGVLR